MSNTDIYLQRAGKSHNLSMGIVGLPNVGKSTLFNSITNKNVPAENYPFCTIDPSEGIVIIEDDRINHMKEIYKPKSIVYATLTVVDIAGLIKGASEGKGLGNAFLEHIRRVDAIFHVVRCFEDADIVHIDDVNPIRDVQIINDELRLKDLELVTKMFEKSKRNAEEKKANALYLKLIDILNKDWINKDISLFNADEIKIINTLNLLTAKNVIILANISEKEFLNKKANKHLINLKKKFNYIPFSAEHEFNLSLRNEKSAVMKKICNMAYKSLNLCNFFTAGSDEVKSWTVRKNTPVPRCGGVIHSDFENYFVMAEVFNYDDLLEFKSENEVKKNGKYMQRGKSYIVNDGDIIFFKSNPPKSGKKK